MHIRKTLLTLMTAAATCGLGAPAQAATLQYANGQFTTFTGFDWKSSGTAFTTGFAPVAGDTFDLTAFAVAAALLSPSTVPAGMDVTADGVASGFGWTLVVNIKQRVTGCFGPGNTICSFQVDPGSTFDIYYAPSLVANSNAGSLGTGFTAGTRIIGGTLDVTGPFGGGTYTVGGSGGTGSASLLSAVTFTNSAFVSPALTTSTLGMQLNLGNLITQWTNPGGFNGVAFNAGNIVFQADMNQTFTEAAQQVPEPHTLGLVTLALLGAVARRRASRP